MCDFACCRACVKQYLLGRPDDPDCMNCHRTLTHEMLLRMLPRSFIEKELKRHREDVLLDRQRALIPSTQNAVEAARERREAMRRIAVLQHEREDLKRRIREVGSLIMQEGRQMREASERSARRQFVMQCAHPECKGFVSEQYKCAACGGFTCSRCHVYKEEGVEHVCDPGAVATIALLKHDSKRCPSCQTWVHRYEGCTQMWCTQCNSMFDYVTLRVIGVHEHFHNPHFTEWLAANRPVARAGRELADIPCGGMPTQTVLSNFLQRAMLAPVTNTVAYQEARTFVRAVLVLHRVFIDVEHVHLPRRRPQVDDAELEQMRVRFCLDDFDEDQWKRQLQRVERRRAKDAEVFLVLQMLVHAGGDLFRQMMTPGARADHGAGPTDVRVVFDEIVKLVQYANQQLIKLAVAFNCTMPMMTTTALVPLSAERARQFDRSGAYPHPMDPTRMVPL